MKAASLSRTNEVLLCGILIVVVLYFARPVLVPVISAALLAMLVAPLANRLELSGMGRVASTFISVFVTVLIFSGIALVIIIQAKNLSSDIPLIKEKGGKMLSYVERYIEDTWNIPSGRQIDFLKLQFRKFIESSGNAIKSMLTGFTGIMGGFVLIFVFMFLLLYQREKYEVFLLRLYKGDDPEKARQVLKKTAKVAQYYLLGRLLSIGLLTVFYTTGLSILGVKNALILSLIASILTFIPYVGTIIGSLFPFVIALITEDEFSTALWTLGIIILVQAVDNYFIEPYVVGGEVNISAFFTILILAIGGFIWGIAGMILFIPMLGIAKIVFDNFDSLEPYGYLVGDQQKGRQSERIWSSIRSIFKRK